jgi:metal-dependent amidase/aminoacylase/carboxypeptidase family protein
LGAPLAELVSELREREHTPVVKDCLNRCQKCELGFVMATVDGTPLGASSVTALLADIDALAAEELDELEQA